MHLAYVFNDYKCGRYTYECIYKVNINELRNIEKTTKIIVI